MRTHLLRTLIKHDLDPQKHTLSPQQISTWKIIIPDVNNELLNQLEFLYRCPFDRCYLRDSVRGIQSECISLLNAADKLKNLPPDNELLLNEAKRALDDMLQVIEEKYADFAARDIFMANCSFNKSLAGIMENYRIQANAFYDRKVDPELQQVILHPIRDVSERKRCTYGKINYLINLQEEMTTLLEITQGDVTEELIELLLSMNFNTDGFFKYYSQIVEQNLKNASTNTEAQWIIKSYEKRFKNPSYRKKKLHFDVNRKCVCSLLSNFLEARMAAPPEPIPRIKIHSLLAVDPLSYLFRLLVDTDVLKPDGKKEFCDLLANLFTTSKTGKRALSGHSFYVKFRSPTRASRRVIRQILNRMIKLTEQEEE
ncbi:hypothetical protein ACXZ1K_05290 [Pedobacter sp. PWIIR3]